MATTHQRTDTVQPMSADARQRLAFADAGLALAGHEITDHVPRDNVERAARHEITADEAIAEARRHMQSVVSEDEWLDVVAAAERHRRSTQTIW